MGDTEITEMWRAVRHMRQEKRADNREQSTKMLEEKDVDLEVKNMGTHLIVRHCGKVVDFWPGTGKWIDRTGPKGRGIRGLLKYIGADQ